MKSVVRAVTMGVLSVATFDLIRWVLNHSQSVLWSSPFVLAIVLAALIGLQAFWFKKENFPWISGAAELMGHVHASPAPDSEKRWAFFSINSTLLTLFGHRAGFESAPFAIAQLFALGTRGSFARWFDQQRRTDAACVLGASITAVFGAPLAALLIPIELGLHGRSVAVFQSVLAAVISSRLFERWLSLDQVRLVAADQSLGLESLPPYWALVLILQTVLIGVLVLWTYERTRTAFKQAFSTRLAASVVASSVLLLLVFLAPKSSGINHLDLAQALTQPTLDTREALALFASGLLLLLATIQGFGVFGLISISIWMAYAVASLMHLNFGVPLQAYTYFSIAGLIGVFLGTPLAGAVLIFEWTQDWNMILPGIVISGMSLLFCRWMGRRTLITDELFMQGMTLDQGRSLEVMDLLTVNEAMVRDFEYIRQEESLAQVRAAMVRSKYPFLMVVNAENHYLGLLAADDIEEEWRNHQDRSELMEAKDLLYKTSFSGHPLRETDPLSSTSGLFEDTPVLPVIDAQNKVAGLLFVYNVRIAYDREVGHRSMLRQPPEVRP